jgi:hypothetical protein
MEVQEFRLEELKDAINSSRRRNDIEEESKLTMVQRLN